MNKKVAIMQPYFFPYIGYFQLINSVDEFIIYDNIQYTKKGWINRNNILLNGEKKLITLPIKHNSDYLNIVDRKISENWINDRKKFFNIIKAAYSKAPYYSLILELLNEILFKNNDNLFYFLFNSILLTNKYLEIKTKINISSNIDINHSLKSQDKVINLCQATNANIYINSIGGIDLYSKNFFKEKGIDLFFLKPNIIHYKQINNIFVPSLSIIDIMMFNSKDDIRYHLNSYSLV